MSKRLILVLTLAFVVGITVGAYAEVQNVKVGGELLFQALHQRNFGLRSSGDSATRGDKENDISNRLLSHAQIKVSADLTDNVSVVVNLLNERAWGLERIASDTNGDVSSTSVDLDLAYVTLKEFLYSPLTLRIGRQAVKFGNGLVIGSGTSATNLASGDTARATNYANGVPRDQRLRKAWDAIRATLDYNPLTVDLLYGKMDDGPNSDRADNIDVYAVNAAYKFSKKTSVEGYLAAKIDGKTAEAGTVQGKASKVYTIGILGRTEPIKNLKTSLEFAGQVGERTVTSTDPATTRRAYAIQAMADYAFKGKKFDPILGATFTHLSGDNQRNDKTYRNWDPMQEGQAPNIVTNYFTMTSTQVMNLRGSMKPVEDITLSANYGYYHFTQKLNETSLTNNYSAGTLSMTESKDGGSALDLYAKYNYTEDVLIGLDIGTFFPGKAFVDARSAVSVMPYLKVTF
ncbi:MAG: alginate export family protein [Candidatus Omnitrophota bacterium]